MKKRLIFMVLCLCMASLMIVPAWAASPETYEEEDIEANYDKHTITFDTDMSEGLMSEEPDARLLTDEERREVHLLNVSEAREFVLSLELKAQGFELVEEACLQELDEYEKMDDIILESYTVLTPKKTTRATPSNLQTFGTKNGRTFYYNMTSQAAYEAKKNSYKTLGTIQNWVNGAVDIMLSFAPYKYTIPYTVFKTTMGTPSGWTVKSDSYVEYFVRIQPTTRNIYTQVGNDWRCLLSNQTGKADPTVVFHNMDTRYPAIVTKAQPSATVTTPSYNDKTTLLNMAYSQWQYNAYGNDPFTQTIKQNLANLSISWG